MKTEQHILSRCFTSAQRRAAHSPSHLGSDGDHRHSTVQVRRGASFVLSAQDDSMAWPALNSRSPPPRPPAPPFQVVQRELSVRQAERQHAANVYFNGCAPVAPLSAFTFDVPFAKLRLFKVGGASLPSRIASPHDRTAGAGKIRNAHLFCLFIPILR